MIEISCTQHDTFNNYYELEKILFINGVTHFYMVLVCKTQSSSERLWSAIYSLGRMIKGDAVDSRAGFSLGKTAQLQVVVPPHAVVLKGDIQKAVDALGLNTQGILRGDNLAALQNNEAVQSFLKKSAQFAATAKSEGERTGKNEENRPAYAAFNSGCCKLF